MVDPIIQDLSQKGRDFVSSLGTGVTSHRVLGFANPFFRETLDLSTTLSPERRGEEGEEGRERKEAERGGP